MSSITYSIYQFDDPRTKEIIYIGVTSNPSLRFRQHLSKRGMLYSLAQELQAEGFTLSGNVLETTSDFQESRELEKMWIQQKKPLLNIIYNQEGIRQREQEEWYAQKIAELISEKGFNYKEAILYLQHFYTSEGDAYTYDIIEKAAQITARSLGRMQPLTGTEILDIALKLIGEGGAERR